MQYVNVFCMLRFCIHVIKIATLGVQLPFIRDIPMCMLLITLRVLSKITDRGVLIVWSSMLQESLSLIVFDRLFLASIFNKH
jgi:hypothetical protein